MPESRGPAPVFLLAGTPGRGPGGDPALSRAIESFGVERPSIAYIGAASGDGKPFFEMLAAHLRRCGAGQVDLAATASGRAAIEKTRALLEAADIVFVSGGDVERGMAALDARGMTAFIRGLHAGGKRFIGVSAGSIMLARQWIRWRSDDDATGSLFACLGIASVLCDTHGEEDGWDELRALLLLSPEGTVGYGIPAGAALLVRPDGAAEAVGATVSRFVRGSAAVRAVDDLAPARR